MANLAVATGWRENLRAMTLLAIAIVLTLILVVADVRSLPANKFDFLRKLGERRATSTPRPMPRTMASFPRR